MRKGITRFIAIVIDARLGRANKKQGVICQAYLEYKHRYTWITEKQISYVLPNLATVPLNHPRNQPF